MCLERAKKCLLPQTARRNANNDGTCTSIIKAVALGFGVKLDREVFYMRWIGGRDENSLECSFCHKREEIVGKLISSPSDYPRAYICNECVAVCASIIEDDRGIEEPGEAVEVTAPHPLLTHPLVSELMGAIERWIREESLGKSAVEEIAEVRRIAAMIAGTKPV